MTKLSRRHFLTNSIPAAIGTTIGLSATHVLANNYSEMPKNKMKILVVGAHPDDPETMSGGAMALYSGMGHEVVAAYLTRGEAGIEGKSHEESARIRTEEAKKACEILKVRPEFLGQIDGSCEINKNAYAQVIGFLEKENPDIIFTHWPIDSHRDHRICSVLVYDAWLTLGRRAALYYGEVMTGIQSQNFTPTDYIDITKVADQKHQACFVHVSQKIQETYPDDHGKMEIFRGMESGCKFAEAYIRHVQSPAVYLK
ncbi:MAG: PIG-L family deacetylase [Bacteroidales bacterium]